MRSTSVTVTSGVEKIVKHKRRYCKVEGCTKIVKSQGLCCRHGAKPKICKIEGCRKQAQGNFDGMCKSHFKAHKHQVTPLPPKPPPKAAQKQPDPVGESVYKRILPDSVGWAMEHGDMPLVKHLKDGFLGQKPPAWHRNEERQARGLHPVYNPATQLEGWERELVWMEILVLTGCPDASFRHLARGWGRDKGFHMVLGQFICERRGDVERKKRDSSGAVTNGHEDDSNDKTSSNAADIWDDACYGDPAYNESLAADLIEFSEAARTETIGVTSKFLSYKETSALDHEEEDIVASDYDPSTENDDDFQV